VTTSTVDRVETDGHQQYPAVMILLVIGGVAGTGKSVLATRLARELTIPRLNSDVIGGTIRNSLGNALEAGKAFSAGYAVLFTLAEEFLTAGSSVIIDTNMGWEFQWQHVDGIASRHPEVDTVHIVLRCPREICLERIATRHDVDSDQASVEQMLRLPHFARIWTYLEDLNRPDVHIIDASGSPDQTYAAAMQHIKPALARRGGESSAPPC